MRDAESPEAAAPDRRPIRVRRWAIFHRAAGWLARIGVSANAISVIGMLAAAVAGALLALTSQSLTHDRWMFLGAAAFIQIRLLCNLLDGLVAVECSRESPTGELFNEAPDRVSDVLILLGAGWASGSSPLLGALTAMLAVLVAYVRVLGRSLGLPSDFRGPMAKQQRMAILTIACVMQATLPDAMLAAISWHDRGSTRSPMWFALALIGVGCVLTAARRVQRQLALLRGAQPSP